MLISRNAYRDVTRKNLLGKGREGSTEDTAGYPFSLVLLSVEGLFILSWMLVASGSLQIEYCVVYLDWSWSLSVILHLGDVTVCQLSFSAPGLVLGHFFIFWDLCQLLDSFNSFALAFVVQL